MSETEVEEADYLGCFFWQLLSNSTDVVFAVINIFLILVFTSSTTPHATAMSTSSAAQKPSHDGWLQNSVRWLGSYAQTSVPAYSLSALFVLSTPFGFASPAQAAAEAAARIERERKLAQASQAASARGSSGLVARLVANVRTQRSVSASTATSSLRTLPPFWQLAFFAAAFGTGGYMVDQGDALNGSGVVTAWSLTYLLFKTLPTAKQLPRNPLALSLSAAVITLGLGVHGSHYFDRTSWRGAIPSLTGADANSEASRSHGRLFSFDTVGSTRQDQVPTSIFANQTSSSIASRREPQRTAGAQQRSDSSRAAMHRVAGYNNDEARTAAFLLRERRKFDLPANAIA